MAPTPESTTRWYQALLPILQAGGPVLTLLLGIILVVSLWYGLHVLKECVAHNRLLNERLLTQQQAMYQEMRLALAHCTPAAKD
jgi:hypothetical protein